MQKKKFPQTKESRDGDAAQLVKHLPSVHEAINSIPDTIQKKKRNNNPNNYVESQGNRTSFPPLKYKPPLVTFF
jgi:hypothetical protein